ncbi:hypothetical protein X727_12500 [Mesorhizobium sp. L103C119B0]|nr:hypothetical protein X727_12500 [Mesorhizobium sp. L103C119B0]
MLLAGLSERGLDQNPALDKTSAIRAFPVGGLLDILPIRPFRLCNCPKYLK